MKYELTVIIMHIIICYDRHSYIEPFLVMERQDHPLNYIDIMLALKYALRKIFRLFAIDLFNHICNFIEKEYSSRSENG